jgi:hypothetical protein
MKLGVYLSPQDRKHGVGVGGKAKDGGAAQQAEYEKLFRTATDGSAEQVRRDDGGVV